MSSPSDASATICLCVLARNEDALIGDCLASATPIVHQIVLLDHGSTDRTAEIARTFGAEVIVVPTDQYPVGSRFDAARNLVSPACRCKWILFLDADERLTETTRAAIRRLLSEHPHANGFELPFKHHFCGQWMRYGGWWPGYTRAQLVRHGRWRYNAGLHTGLQVDPPVVRLPADNPDAAILHYSYRDLEHYLTKLNGYTSGEAESLLERNLACGWREEFAALVEDWSAYLDRGHSYGDGLKGEHLAFLSGVYRWLARAKAADRALARGLALDQSTLPTSVEEILLFMLWCVRNPSGRAEILSRPQPSMGRSVPLVWRAPIFGPSGFASEAREFVLGLSDIGLDVLALPEDWRDGSAGLSLESEARLRSLGDAPDAVGVGLAPEIAVVHTLASAAAPIPGARIQICRTMFETDRLPSTWVDRLRQFHEVWVPTEFHRLAFLQSGLDADQLRVVPGAIAAEAFRRERNRWPLPGEERFRFLSVFDWSLHKGWDRLLEAFALEFGGASRERPANLDVGLVIKTWSTRGLTSEQIRGEADAWLRSRFGKGVSDFPNIHFWHERIPEVDLPKMYRSVQAYVLASRGEGWGRPLMEAMAAGLPTIATAWSGPTAYHSDRVGYPLPCQVAPVSEAGAREVPFFRGHNWAEPDTLGLQRLMARIVARPSEARRKGALAARFISRWFSRAKVAQLVAEELKRLQRANPERRPPSSVGQPPAVPSTSQLPERPIQPYPPLLTGAPALPVDFSRRLGRPLRVRWEGDQRIISSLALVNRELCIRLLQHPDIELSLGESPTPWHTLTDSDDPRYARLFQCLGRELSGPPDVTIRHHFPPRWERPPSGKLVVFQPWEYGHLPEGWVDGATAADEIWVYSRWVRDVYVRSGVPAEKVKLIPLGFDPEVFQPHGKPFALPVHRQTRFLFVGGTLDRKGADLLLKAYLGVFRPDDDVMLVVKDTGVNTFYRDGTFAGAFRAAAQDDRLPKVVYLDEDMPSDRLASLYRAASCLVLPYRGEGFALAPLEAAACGVPSIVPSGGPTDDYLNSETSIRIPAIRKLKGKRGVGLDDSLVCVGDPWQLEPDIRALAGALLEAHRRPEILTEVGERAAAHVREGWTWERSELAVRGRLERLTAGPTTIPPQRPTPYGRASAGRNSSIRRRRPRGEWHAGRPALSLCVIARDEAARIGQLLESFLPFVGEMIVVDTGSVDETPEIARAMGARVARMDWPDCFSTARNASLDLARGWWVIVADADDVLPAACGRELVRIVTRHLPKDVGGEAVPEAAYKVQIRIPPGPGESRAAVVDHVKLFPNRDDIRYTYRIHEQVLPAIRGIGLPVLDSGAHLIHQNYDRTPKGQEKKRARDEHLLYLQLQDRPGDAFCLFNLGMTHLEAWRDYEVAAQFLSRSIDRSDPRDSIVNKAYALLHQARATSGEWELAEAVMRKGLSLFPDDEELLYRAGQHYLQIGKPEDARRNLEHLVALSGNSGRSFKSVEADLATCAGPVLLAQLFRHMGDPTHAVQVLEKVVVDHADYWPAHLELATALTHAGRLDDASRVLGCWGAGGHSRRAGPLGGEAGACGSTLTPVAFCCRHRCGSARELTPLPGPRTHSRLPGSRKVQDNFWATALALDIVSLLGPSNMPSLCWG